MIAAPFQPASPNRSPDPLTLSDTWAPTADPLFVGRVRRADRAHCFDIRIMVQFILTGGKGGAHERKQAFRNARQLRVLR